MGTDKVVVKNLDSTHDKCTRTLAYSPNTAEAAFWNRDYPVRASAHAKRLPCPTCSRVQLHARAKAATAEQNTRPWGTKPAWIWRGVWEQGSPSLVTGWQIRSALEFWLVLGPPLHAPQSVSSPYSGPLAPQDSSPLGQRLPLLRNMHNCGGQGRLKPSTASKQGKGTTSSIHSSRSSPAAYSSDWCQDHPTTGPRLHEVPNLALLVLALHSFGATVLMPGGRKNTHSTSTEPRWTFL